jgi:hypothetical protein
VPRALLAICLVALGVAAAADPAAAWMPRPVEFEQPVAVPAAAHAAGGWLAIAPLSTTRRFDMVGVQWRGSTAVKIDLRARSHTGRWSRWATAGVDPDGPDPAEGRAAAGRSHLLVTGEPLWAGGSDHLQLRLSGSVRDLRLRLINTTGTATARDRARTAARAAQSGPPGTLPLPVTHAGVPPIIPRAAWGASRCKPRVAPGFGRVQLAFVHHTVSLNSYPRSESAAVVLGVCLFHRDGRGWNDMGYNFLVDRFGRVFEGRAGGIDQPVVGAQAGGFNVPSTGISMIGDFTSVAPPRKAMDALARLLAWKLSIHGAPATGHTTVTSAGGPSTSHPAGAQVTLQRISGHRDADLTDCPGAALYRQIPALRSRVAALEGPVSELSLTTSAASVPYGSGPTASGALAVPGGQPGAGEPIEVRALSGGRETVLATTTTGPDGSWSVALPPLTRNALLRAVFAGQQAAGRPGVISPLVAVRVDTAVGMTAQQQSVPAGSSAVVNGTVRPARPRVTISAYQVLADGSLKRLRSQRAGASGGIFTASIPLPRPGRYRLVASVPAGGATGAGRSAPVEVQATP